MKKCALILVSLSLLGFQFFRDSFAYEPFNDIRARIQQIEAEITNEEKALILLKDTYAAIQKEKERVIRYIQQRRQSIENTLRETEEKQRYAQEQNARREKALIERAALCLKKQVLKESAQRRHNAARYKQEELEKQNKKTKKLRAINDALDMLNTTHIGK